MPFLWLYDYRSLLFDIMQLRVSSQIKVKYYKITIRIRMRLCLRLID